MRYWFLAAIIIAFSSLLVGRTIANTGYMGNGYYATIEIQMLVLIGTVIICSGLIVNTIKNRDK